MTGSWGRRYSWSWKIWLKMPRKEIWDLGCGMQRWGRRRVDAKWTMTWPTTKMPARKRADSNEHENELLMGTVDQPVRIHRIHVYKHTFIANRSIAWVLTTLRYSLPNPYSYLHRLWTPLRGILCKDISFKYQEGAHTCAVISLLFWMVLAFIRKGLPTQKLPGSKHLG